MTEYFLETSGSVKVVKRKEEAVSHGINLDLFRREDFLNPPVYGQLSDFTYLIPSRELTTVGERYLTEYFTIPNITNFTKDAWDNSNQLANVELKREVKSMLVSISFVLEEILPIGYNNNSLPPVSGFAIDNDSFLIEWQFPHLKLGYHFDSDHTTSSWYFVSDEKHGSISAAGFLKDIDYNSLNKLYVNFIVSLVW